MAHDRLETISNEYRHGMNLDELYRVAGELFLNVVLFDEDNMITYCEFNSNYNIIYLKIL